MTKQITLNDWLTELYKIEGIGADKVPEGWKTSVELMTEWGQGRTSTLRAIRRLIKSGLWEEASFKTLTKRNRPYTTPFYRPKPKKK